MGSSRKKNIYFYFVICQVFLAQEDCDAVDTQDALSPKPTDDDEEEERVRRQYLILNNLESDTPFFFLGLAYAMSKVRPLGIEIGCDPGVTMSFIAAKRNRGKGRLRHFRRLPNHAHGKDTLFVTRELDAGSE